MDQSAAALFGLPASARHESLSGPMPLLSVVVPMFNEAGEAPLLVREIATALQGVLDFEIVLIDDGSTDETSAAILPLKAEIPQLRILAHTANAGQSRAIRTGILAARGSVIATLDGDGQNDPADIPALVDQLLAMEAAPDLMMVAGERQKRQDTRAKKWASKAANHIRAWALKDGASDTGCGLKVFYRAAFERLPYFDHCHRYLPALFRREGFAVDFAPVNHRPRRSGVSKYTNLGRLAVAFRDLLGVMWLIQRARTPKSISEL